jgi:hypothetical protein
VKRAASIRPIASILVAAAITLGVSPAAAGKSCVETGDTVGETKCSRFGDFWAIEKQPPFVLRFGFRYSEFSTNNIGFKESFRARNRPKNYTGYYYRGHSLGVKMLSGYGIDGGLTGFVVGQLYAGIDGAVLFGSARTATFTTHNGSHTISDGSGSPVDITLVYGGIPIGYRIPLGRASIRGELVTGVASASVSHVSTGNGHTGSTDATGARLLVEPRIAGDIWFTQHMSFGAYAGMNVIDRGAPAIGLTLAYHIRAFDGDMSLW